MEPSAVIPIDLELATLETLERSALMDLIVEQRRQLAPCVRIDVASLEEILCEPKGAKVGPR
jgi:hypothetical protein